MSDHQHTPAAAAAADFGDLRETWIHFGQTDAHWSVLTDPRFKRESLTSEATDAFYQTGEGDVRELEAILRAHTSGTLAGKTVLDFGCGLGRVLGHLKRPAFGALRAFGMDVSQPHLQVAAQAVPDAEYFLVTSPAALPALPQPPDVIYSLITLQHNRPALIKQFVRLLLGVLAPGGTALLHIPYRTPWAQPQRGKRVMEMHAVPKMEIYGIINECGCMLVGEDTRDRCGGGILNTMYVVSRPL